MSEAVDCHYEIQGEGPPLILIHGVGSSGGNWQKIVDVLQHEFMCICCDLRGHGASPKPPTPYTLDMLVADLEQLRCRLNIEKFHVTGHSLGGMIGPAYAHQYPSRILSLGMLSTAAFRTQKERQGVNNLVDKLEDSGIEPLLDSLIQRWFTPQLVNSHPEIVEARRQQVLGNDPAVFASVFRIYATTEMEHFLHEIKAPTLVLTGENDGGCNPRINHSMAAALPNSELRILPQLRHSILLEAPQIVAENLLSFLLKHK